MNHRQNELVRLRVRQKVRRARIARLTDWIGRAEKPEEQEALRARIAADEAEIAALQEARERLLALKPDDEAGLRAEEERMVMAGLMRPRTRTAREAAR
jgi:hypothetical protein